MQAERYIINAMDSRRTTMLTPVSGLRGRRCLLLALALVLLAPACQGGDRIRLLILAKEDRIPMILMFYGGDPSVECTMIPARSGVLSDSELKQQIRLYFPRTYQGLLGYDVLAILSPSYDMVTTQQDAWMHDAIAQGLGGLSESSLFSQLPGIAQAWANGLASRAFPNDAVAVIARGAEPKNPSYRIKINEAYPEPVLTVFVPLGVEDVYAYGGTTRLMIPLEGSGVLAWQIGSFPGREGYIAAWEYGQGRTMATGAKIPQGWLAYPTGVAGENRYSPAILSNMIYWIAGTDLIDDVVAFQRMRSELSLFRTKITVLASFRDFVERLGATTEGIDEEIAAVQELYSLTVASYADHNFVESEAALQAGLERLSSAEEVAKRVKDRALLWVYAVEWLVFFSASFVSGFIIWTLMVRRRLYQSVRTTRLASID